ncbi:S49 family peptidase [Luteimonas sp. MHLX1A]|uniref:S49 family peptidase n=1 Tax=Alterluteimonas muca TaxID=2878684 RepID=UPI001E3C472F|nr:S49 family peptidase [Luteimonas sp. MHLX1A]MCD9046845.1 S49 family peptidase [Luteimonas sp. MHLX1A]
MSERDRAVVDLARDTRTFLDGLASHLVEKEQSERRWRTIKRASFLLVAVGVVAMWVLLYAPLLGWSRGPSTQVVAVIPIEGVIGSGQSGSADRVVPLIRRACESKLTTAVVMRIDSPGGSPADADEIGSALAACRADGRAVPVLAVVDGLGASAAYLIAAHADEVFASRYALVGSLGAVMRNLDAATLAERLGLRERVYTSGPLKSGNSPWSVNTPEQDALNQALVEDMGQIFATQVRELRAGKLGDDPALFTGRVWTADAALGLGLVDGISSFEDLRSSRFDDLPTYEYRSRASFHDRIGLTARAFASGISAALTEN